MAITPVHKIVFAAQTSRPTERVLYVLKESQRAKNKPMGNISMRLPASGWVCVWDAASYAAVAVSLTPTMCIIAIQMHAWLVPRTCCCYLCFVFAMALKFFYEADAGAESSTTFDLAGGAMPMQKLILNLVSLPGILFVHTHDIHIHTHTNLHKYIHIHTYMQQRICDAHQALMQATTTP